MDKNEVKRKIKSFNKFLRKNKGPHKRKRMIYKIYITLLQLLYSIFPQRNGICVANEEWDYLIILDACRYDTFKKFNKINGKLEKKISRGSGTREWAKNNFKKYYNDIVYVSSNPFISNYNVAGWRGVDHFFDVENVWDYGWDSELGTVPPKNTKKAALKMKDKYPNKRMIVHFMQPHGPWIGNTKLSAKEAKEELGGGSVNCFVPAASYFWDQVNFGKMPVKKIMKAYEENLILVLKEVDDLIKKLNGRIIITADHGTSFGKWNIYKHPRFIRTKDLKEIPWMIIEKNKKNKIKTPKKESYPKKKREINEIKIKERLASLGYV